MMATIYKYAFEVTDHVSIAMPEGADLLCVQTQGHTQCIWAIVNPDLPLETRRFRVYGTGHPLDETPGIYVGTFQLMGGSLVFHVFERVSA